MLDLSVFFFKQKTAYEMRISDWSSDVCSSDLVLAFRSSRAMRAGHVAMVSKVLSNREVLLNHANWSYRGGVEQDALAVDVSPEGDWSEVRVWYGPSGQLGIRSNPAYGFIYPEASSGAGNLTIASADLSRSEEHT